MNFNDYSDDIVFGFNTRTGGVSTGVYDSMNLSLTLPDDPEDVKKNYEIWCRDLGVRVQDLVIGLQTHTNNVVRVDERNKGQGLFRTRMKDVDGMVTNVPGVALVTYHADCTPVYLYDPVKKSHRHGARRMAGHGKGDRRSGGSKASDGVRNGSGRPGGHDRSVHFQRIL